MSIQITSFSDIDASLVSQYQTELTELLQEQYPALNLRQGVFRDLVQYLNAIYAAKQSQELDRYKSAQSLLKIEENPELADDGVVDQILSNYNIQRRAGTVSRGNLVLKVNRDTTLFLPSGTAFISDNMQFETETPITIYRSDSGTPAAASDRILRKGSDGYYGCTIPVVSQRAGTLLIKKDASFSTAENFTNFVKIYAAEDFTAGTDEESNLELISRLKSGMATPSWGNRQNIERLIRSQTSLSDMPAMSITGMGDPEMRRDIAPLIPFSTGSKTDIYLKAKPSVSYTSALMNAMKTGESAGKIQWQIYVSSAPGVYRATRVNRPGVDDGLGYEILDQSAIETSSDLSPEDAAYSARQALLVSFETDDIVTEDTSYEFEITFAEMQGVQEVQALLDSDRYAPVNCDVLVKACIPAFVDAELTLMIPEGSLISDDLRLAVESAIANEVNQSGFEGGITVGQLIHSLQNVIPTVVDVYSLRISGEIWSPNGDSYFTESTEALCVPDDPENYVTRNTVAFFMRNVTVKSIYRF